MSDREASDIDDQRLTRDADRDGPASFADKCSDCGHSRADHLAIGTRNPAAATVPCAVAVCGLKHVHHDVACPEDCEDGHEHVEKACNPKQCDCKWRLN